MGPDCRVAPFDLEGFSMRWVLSVVFVALSLSAGCRPRGEPTSQSPPGESPPAAARAPARKGLATKLRVRGPAPQPYRNVKPPAGVREVAFESGELRLKGWLSGDANDGKKRPAVVFLHGGWAFDDGDWADA